jgi:hypothetical protein
MRSLILCLSLLVVALAVSILVQDGPGARAGSDPLVHVGRWLHDAGAGEKVTYRDDDGNTVTFVVEGRSPASLRGTDRVLVRRQLRDRLGQPMGEGWDIAYEHDLGRHGWTPLVAPGEVDGHDRLWIWVRIRRESLRWRGRDRPCWRVDYLDPALPTGRDAVQVWFDDAVPVFGMLEWRRGGRTWRLESSEPDLGGAGA